MRKLIVSMNVTLDGFLAGPLGELDWHFDYWTGEMLECACSQLHLADTILLGRYTYRAMAEYWPYVMNDPCYPRGNFAFAEMMNNHRKIVFSRTLEKSGWNNTEFSRENTKEKFIWLKSQPGKHLILYGSASILVSLIRWRLVDEYILWVHPLLLGSGKKLFSEVPVNFVLKLDSTKIFSSGVVMMCYNVV